MNGDLNTRLSALADEMTDTNYDDLRGRVEHTYGRLRRRRMAVASTLSAFVVTGAVVAGTAVLAARNHSAPPPPASTPTTGTVTPAPTPSGAPSPNPSGKSGTATALPGTLTYLTVRHGQPITVTRVTDGLARTSTFGTATVSDEYVAVASPDGAKVAVVESPDPGNLMPGDLVVVAKGGKRSVLAHNVTWAGGAWPTWSPDSRRILVGGASDHTGYDVATGARTTQPGLSGYAGYLTWSPSGTWVAYHTGDTANGIAVSRADGTGLRRVSLSGLPECQQRPACPTAVQAVSDDGRYVAVGHGNTDPSHVVEAHLVIDVRTGRPVATARGLTGTVDRIWFRPDGSRVVRSGQPGRYMFSLVEPDGTVTATFPDTRTGGATQVAGYQP
jgi:hypothetical protein